MYAQELRGLSYDEKKVYEGYAEFVRLWATQTGKAKEAAPNFYRWFENWADTHEYGPALREAQRGMTAWFDQDALSRAASKIGEQKALNVALDGPLDDFRQSVADDLHGVLRMERDLFGQPQPLGAYETARLTRSAYSVVEGALTIGAPRVTANGSHEFVGKSLQDVLDPVAKELDDFTLYAVGRSARELLEQGRENLFTKTEIDAMVELETPAFAKAFDNYQQWNAAVLDFAEAKGLINPESRKLWRRTQYLPFHRSGQEAPTKRAGGTEGDWRGIRKLTGGTSNIRDPLHNMISNAGHLITEALRNEARVAVADIADAAGGGGRFMVKIPKDTKPVSVDKRQIEKLVYEMLGIDQRLMATGAVPADMMEAAAKLTQEFSEQPDFMQFWAHGQAPKGDNVIAVLRNGKPDYYEVADPLLYRSIESLSRPAKGLVTRFFGAFRRVGQSSITLSADFMAANLARDTLMGAIISKHGFRPFVDSVRGFKSRLTKDPAYREFIANGGGFSSYLVDEGAFKRHLERFYAKKNIDYRTVLDTPAKLLHAVESMVDAFEMSTRLGEYKRARARGEPPRRAAYEAREVSTDFAMRGDSEAVGFLYDSVMFLKAGINGMDRLYRGVVHDPNRAAIAGKTAMLALMSTGLYALNRGNPLYEQLEDWDRDTSWHFFVPKAGSTEDTPIEERYHHFRYPKIWEMGAVASIAERSMERVLDDEPKEFAEDVFRISTDLFKLDFVPQALGPLYEQAMNRSRFTERPIEGLAEQNLEPFARAKPYTSETLQELGMATRNLPREFQVSPARAEALIRGYLNTWGAYGLMLSDAIFFDDQPEMRIDQYPVFKRFYAAEPARHTRYETEFYNMLREATEARRTLRWLDKQGRTEIADELDESPAALRYRALNQANKELKGIRGETNELYDTEGMPPKEKRRRLDELQAEKNAHLKQVMTEIEAAQKEGS